VSRSRQTGLRRVLFLCTGNSCRSQITEALVNSRMGDRWQAFSAATRPAGFVHPLALRVLSEIGITVTEAKSKGLEEMRGTAFDLVVTVCDQAAEECPVWLGKSERAHLGFPDPSKARGRDVDVINAFRSVRDNMGRLIPSLLKEHEDG
jgi:arsenate reductase